jgi:hypothetical protein
MYGESRQEIQVQRVMELQVLQTNPKIHYQSIVGVFGSMALTLT